LELKKNALHKIVIRNLFIGMLLLASWHCHAQQPQDRTAAEQYRLDQEQRKKAMLMQTMDSAVVLMEQGDYAAADKKFMHVLNNIKSVPSDLTYYFGKNSFFMNKYKQSIDWLTKYIQLKGTSGQHYQDAVSWLKKSESELLKVRTAEASKAQEILSKQYDIDCGPSGKVTCPVCKGNTVIIRRGAFGDEYRSCGFCDKHGMLTCEQYNLLIRGELQPRDQ
jgi:tetratricopeptide (TPR) repeat protein